MTRLTVGEVGKRVGLTGKAIRLYEARGLVPTPERTDSGYRSYTEHHVAILRFIRQARALGLSLEEIREILDLQRTGAQPCGTVLQLLTARIREIDTTMANLRALRKALVRARDTTLVNRDQGQEAVICQIIEAQPTA
jgi:DNA-binding transcriptional MerR regulator